MNTSGDWIEIKIQADSLLLEELSPYFFRIGCQGIDEHSHSFTLYFPGKIWDDAKKSELVTILEQKNIMSDKISYHSLKDENWNENWKESFKTFRLGENIVVKPDWEVYKAQEHETVVSIAPKMAFGTGHHETTKLILMQLEQIIKPRISVLDAGTGSAILAIYCALMGAHRITAFDIDPVAVENAAENAMLNNVTGKLQLKCCTLQEIVKEAYDLIVANINRNVLLEMAPALNVYVKPGTVLLLSGLLRADRAAIQETYAKEGWQMDSSAELGEWLLLKMIRS